MLVSELISLVNLFAFGRNNPTELQRASFLLYLNMADQILFRCLKNSKRSAQNIDLFFEDNAGDAILPDNYIFSVNTDNLSLDKLDKKTNLHGSGYYFLNNRIYIKNATLNSKIDPSDGITKRYLKLTVRPLRLQLVETVKYPQPIVPIETDTPVYPEEFHLSLVHGAVYFLCLSQLGFRDKLPHFLQLWQDAQKDLTSHYQQDK